MTLPARVTQLDAFATLIGIAVGTVNFLLHVGGVTTPRAGGGTFNVTGAGWCVLIAYGAVPF